MDTSLSIWSKGWKNLPLWHPPFLSLITEEASLLGIPKLLGWMGEDQSPATLDSTISCSSCSYPSWDLKSAGVKAVWSSLHSSSASFDGKRHIMMHCAVEIGCSNLKYLWSSCWGVQPLIVRHCCQGEGRPVSHPRQLQPLQSLGVSLPVASQDLQGWEFSSSASSLGP